MTLTTHEMLMALEEMPPHTLYRGFLLAVQSAIVVYRCDCLPVGAYVLVGNPLTGDYGIPRFWVERDDFLLDLGYRGRGIAREMRWTQAEGAANPCDDPEIAESLVAIREQVTA